MSQNELNNPSYVVINGVTYFKLKSDYPGDYTKNCGLLGEEIDKNFFFLRSNDIKEVTVDNDGLLTLTRVDDEKITSVAPFNDYKFEYDNIEGKLKVKHPNGTEDVLEGFLVEQFVNANIVTDETLYGKGTPLKPFGLSPVERTGTFAPVNEFIDMTYCDYFQKICHVEDSLYSGDDSFKWYEYSAITELPKGAFAVEKLAVPEPKDINWESPKYIFVLKKNTNTLPTDKGKGYRIISKELVDNYGLFYTYDGVKLISEKLQEKESEWRVPTRQDWADLLNAAEFCEEDRDHDITCVNEWTGKHAGARAKSTTIWLPTHEQDAKGEDNLPETGNHTFKVLPVGYGEGLRGLKDYDNDIEGFRKVSSFWSSSEVGICPNGDCFSKPNMYTRAFSYNSGKVLQESTKPSSRLSLRLVRDFNPNTHLEVNEFENILGYNIPTVFITNEETNYSQIWTSINVGFKEDIFSGTTSKEWAMTHPEERGVCETYFVNEWNGLEWIKKPLKEGDSVVILNYEKDSATTVYNHEWRIYSGETYNQVVLKDTSEAMSEEIEKEIERLDNRIDNEEKERIKSDSDLQIQISEEVQHRVDEISGLTIVEIPSNEDGIKAIYKLMDLYGNQHGDAIKVYNDETIHEIRMGHTGASVNPDTGEITDDGQGDDALLIVYRKNNGKYDLVKINLDELFKLNAGDGIMFDGGKIHVKIDESSDEYLSVSSSGVCLTGVKHDILEEASARTIADIVLQEEIDEITVDIPELKEKLNEEISARTEGDIVLQEEIDEIWSAMTSMSGSSTQEKLERISGDTSLAKVIGASGNSDNEFCVEFVRPEYVLSTHSGGKDFDHVPEYNEIVEGGYWDFVNNCPNSEYQFIDVGVSHIIYELVPHTHYIRSAKSFIDAVATLDNQLKDEENKINNEIERAIYEDNYLQEQITSNKVASDDKTINIFSSDTGTSIEVNIDNITLQKDINGIIHTNLKISAVTPSEVNVREEFKLTDDNNSDYGNHIKIYKDHSLFKAYLGHVDDTIDVETAYITPGSGATALCLVYILESQKYDLVKIDISKFVEENEFSSGLTVDNHIVKVLIDSTSESFLTVGPSGVRLSGIQSAISGETQRAIMAENTLQVALDGEVAERNAAIAEETSRATSAENSLRTAIENEVTLRDAAIKIEEQRALAAEATLQTNINNEVVARDSAILIETQRAESAEAGLVAQILQEITDRNAAIDVEKSRAMIAEGQLSAGLSGEVTARNSAIAEETANRKAADDVLNAGLTALTENVNELKTNLYSNNDNPDSIKHIILTDTVIATEVTAEPAVNQSLLRKVNGKFYASNNSSDMFYKNTKLEEIIDNLIINSGSSESEIIELKDAMASATTRIETLETELSVVSGALVTLKETMEQTIKDTVAAILKGTDYEIKVDTTDSSNIKIGFDDNAIFGPII